METKISFIFVAETKGALRYAEINDAGQIVENDKARVGTLYFRKTRFGELSAKWASEGAAPKVIQIAVIEEA